MEKIKNPLPEWLLKLYSDKLVEKEFVCIVQIFLLHLRYKIKEKKRYEHNLLKPKQMVHILIQTCQFKQFSDLDMFPFLKIFVIQCVRKLASLDPRCGEDLASKLNAESEADFKKLYFPLPKMVQLNEEQIEDFKRKSFYKRAKDQLFAFLSQFEQGESQPINTDVCI